MGNFALVLALLLVIASVINAGLTLKVERRKREADQQSRDLAIHNIQLPVGAFTDSEGNVINYEGLNYYRACDVYVADRPEGGHTFCVMPVNHEGKRHMDFQGRSEIVP